MPFIVPVHKLMLRIYKLFFMRSITPEMESDHCLAELLSPTEGMMCRMSDTCQHRMTKAGMQKYPLVHQVLYTVVAEMVGIAALYGVGYRLCATLKFCLARRFG